MNKFLGFFLFLYCWSGFCAYPTYYLDLSWDVNTEGQQATVTIPATTKLYEVVIQARYYSLSTGGTTTEFFDYLLRKQSFVSKKLYVFVQDFITDADITNKKTFIVTALMYRIEFSKNRGGKQSLNPPSYSNSDSKATSRIFWTRLYNKYYRVQATCSVQRINDDFVLTFNLPPAVPWDYTFIDTYTFSIDGYKFPSGAAPF